MAGAVGPFLPPLLKFNNGSDVNTPEAWRERRREVSELVQNTFLVLPLLWSYVIRTTTRPDHLIMCPPRYLHVLTLSTSLLSVSLLCVCVCVCACVLGRAHARDLCVNARASSRRTDRRAGAPGGDSATEPRTASLLSRSTNTGSYARAAGWAVCPALSRRYCCTRWSCKAEHCKPA